VRGSRNGEARHPALFPTFSRTRTRFGKVLRDMREGAGLPQAVLARHAGVSHSHISRLEAGRRVPHAWVIERVAKVLELDDAERAELYVAAFIPEDLYAEAGVVLRGEGEG
jgi:transcriptional regulator with XRE-family HTH domain